GGDPDRSLGAERVSAVLPASGSSGGGGPHEVWGRGRRLGVGGSRENLLYRRQLPLHPVSRGPPPPASRGEECLPPFPEERSQHFRRFRLADPRVHLRGMVAGGLGEESRAVHHRSALRVGGGEIEAPDPR